MIAIERTIRFKRRFIAALFIAIITVVGTVSTHAQQTGPTVYQCDSETVDANYYNDNVEQTVCLSGDASGLDAYNEVDLEQYQQNVIISSVGADARVYGPSGLVMDTGEQDGYSVSVSGWIASPQIGQWYTLYGLYDECDDPNGDGNTYACNWTGLMYGDSLSAMITGTPTPTLSVATSGTPSTWTYAVTFTATISSGPWGSLTFYDGSTGIGTATIGGNTASITVDNLAPGSHSITAYWPGSPNYNATTSSPLTQTINEPSTLVYGYSMGAPGSPSGYAATGTSDVLGYFDSVMGSWRAGYDSLNRLNSVSFSPAIAGLSNFCWQYDDFGNRTNEYGSNQSFTGTQPCSGSILTNTWAYYTVDGTSGTPDNGKNQITSTPVGYYTYDGAGDVLNDGVNQYLYDAEGRICAVYNGSTITGYLYDGLGQRIVTGALSSFACNTGFTPGTEEFYGQNGEELTGVSVSGSTLTWQHTNVYGPEGLFATYDPTGLHFIFSDWLGNRRVQTNYAGGIEQTCQNLPFGNAPSCTAPSSFGFAGLQNDAGGLDHADARQYAPVMGRWTEPDPFDGSMDGGNPQTLNRYNYAGNSPLSFTDSTGLNPEGPGGGFPGLPPELPPIFGGGGGSSGPIMSQRPDGDPHNAQIWDEYHIHFGSNIGAALGLPSTGGCEFGVCDSVPFGENLTAGQNPSGSNPYPGIISDAAWVWAMTGIHYKVHGLIWKYGHWCGEGGSGSPVSKVDAACLQHDFCYYSHGNLQPLDNLTGFNPNLLGCNQALCDVGLSVERSENHSGGDIDQAGAALDVVSYFHGLGNIIRSGNRCKVPDTL